MKAFVLEGPDQPAHVMDIPRPEMGQADVLVAVKAASVNGFDIYQASGGLTGMMEHVFPTVVGRDFAGIIEAVGPEFRGFVSGHDVLGFIPATPPLHSGSFAGFVSGGSSLALARKPAGLSFAEAAALPLVGSAALDLLDAVEAQDGDVVLIVGATGGVGILAVQIAARRGLEVVATALPHQGDFMLALGAADTIDYSAGSVADAVRSLYPDGVAALIDVVNRKDALAELTSVVRPGGRVGSLMNAADTEQLALRQVGGTNVRADPTPEKLSLLAGMAASGSLRVEIQATYPLDQAGEALQAFRNGTLGKIILAI